MATKIVTSENTLLCLLPETIDEQRRYKRFVKDNRETFTDSIRSFREFMILKYDNSIGSNDEEMKNLLANATYIANASVFGFCHIQFADIENIYKEKNFSSLQKDIEEIVKLINTNEKIAVYLEGRTIKEVITERVETSKKIDLEK